MSGALTFAGAEDGGVGEQQQHVVEEALQHGRLHLGISQVLAGHCRPTDQQGQDLAHHDGLQQPPGESGTALGATQKSKLLDRRVEQWLRQETHVQTQHSPCRGCRLNS